MNFLIAGLSIVYLIICGYGLVKLILKDNIPFSLFGLIPLCFGVGLTVMAVFCEGIMLIGLKLSFYTIYLPLFILFSYALTQIKIVSVPKIEDITSVIKKLTWTEWFYIFVVLFGVISVFLLSIDFPLHFWDSRAIWAAKGKMLYYDGSVFSSAFTDINRINAHFRYPLLYPISQAYLYFGMGSADDWALMLMIGLFFPFIVSFLYDLTRIYFNNKLGIIAASMVISLPIFFMLDGTSFSGYADTPLALIFILAFGTMLLWKKYKKSEWLILSSILTAATILTKNEGINLIMLNLALLILPQEEKSFMDWLIKTVKGLLICISILIVATTPWLILVRHFAIEKDTNDIFQLGASGLFASIYKLPFILNYSFNAFIGIQKNMMGQGFLWGFIWPIFILTTIIAFIKRSIVSINLSLIVLLNIVFISLGYVIMPGTAYEGMISNFFRICFPINAVIALQIVSVLYYLERAGFEPAKA